MDEAAIDYLEARIPEMARNATHQAYLNALASGRSVLVAIDGVLYEDSPNGERTFVRALEPPFEVEPGLSVQIH